MNHKPSVLILATASLHNGPRMIREMNTLKNDYTITAIGSTPPNDASVRYIDSQLLHYPLLYKAARKLYRLAFKRILPVLSTGVQRALNRILDDVHPDIVIVHDALLIPYLFNAARRNFKIVYNAHEYHPLEFDENKEWLRTWGKYFYGLYAKYLHKIDLVINVCQSIADKCVEEFGKESLVIPNAATYQPELKPSAFDGSAFKIIHHGGAIRERGIELMIDAVNQLGTGYSLDLMLVHIDEVYYEKLKSLVAATNNVRLIAPVAFDKIVPLINTYDIGLFNLPPKSYNYKVALPNKLFEFIQARLCIVVSPSIEMKNVVERYNLGKVSTDFTAEAIAEAIRSIDAKMLAEYKHNADKITWQVSAEQYQEKLQIAIKNLLK